MQKLIDADKLKQHYAWWDNEDKKIFDTIVDLQPEAVVRCKDCRLSTVTELRELYCYRLEDIVGAEDYCSKGERREDE